MADIITLDAIVEQLNTDINALSTTLKASAKITRAIPFNVVANVQDYEDSKVYDADAIVAGIARSLTGTFAPSQNYSAYSDNVLITFYAFTNDVDDLEIVLNEYASAFSGKWVRSGDWIYQANFDRPTIGPRDVDEGEERVIAYLNLTYSFIENGYIASDIMIKIDDVIVPVLSYNHNLVKSGKSSDSKSEGGVVTTRHTKSTITKTIKFIHIANASLTLLLQDIDSGNFLNRTYTVFYGLSCNTSGTACTYNNVETMVLNSGDIDFIENGFQFITATFLVYKDLS